MAYFERRGDRWRAQIRRKGVEQSRTFRTKAQAKEWALQVEAGITGDKRPVGRQTVLEAFRKYAKEISPLKRGGRWERIRLKALESSGLAKLKIAQVTGESIGVWKNERLTEVSASSVKREMNLLTSVFETAKSEWHWIPANPCRGVRKPSEPPARRRGVKDGELERLAEKLSGTLGKEVLAGFELAIETGMRAGEMWSLTRDQIDLKHAVVHLDKTKNGDKRDVALSPRAVEIVRALLADKRVSLFTVRNSVRDALFRKARDAAGIPDIHFHDSRAEAVSRLSKILKVQDLADQIGHRDLNSLMSYYKPSAQDRAKQLGAAQAKQSLQKPPTEA